MTGWVRPRALKKNTISLPASIKSSVTWPLSHLWVQLVPESLAPTMYQLHFPSSSYLVIRLRVSACLLPIPVSASAGLSAPRGQEPTLMFTLCQQHVHMQTLSRCSSTGWKVNGGSENIAIQDEKTWGQRKRTRFWVTPIIKHKL